jgi:SAM-dependent methyltransferase
VDRREVELRKADLERRHGPWTAHNVRLADGLFTLGSTPSGDEVKLRRVLQVVADLAGKPFSELRVLDLACLEGMYALEFATRGSQVVAIEGREANLAKARFAAEALAVDGVEWVLGDVRDLSRERHGRFDVVLCLGILYHLDAADVFALVERIADVCRSLLVVDTHVAPQPRASRTHRGRTYWGRVLVEHEPDETEEVRMRRLWSSLDNLRAFAPTRPSLLNLLADNGFSSVLECHFPPEPEKEPHRVTLVARRGERLTPIVSPPPDWAPIPERRRSQEPRAAALARRLSRPARPLLRKVLRRPGRFPL